MVLPEGTGSELSAPRRSARWTILAVALGALGIGALALGALTSPNPQTAVNITTSTTATTTIPLARPIVDPETFTVDQIAVGEPLDWTKVATVDDLYPIGLVSSQGRLYAFATPTQPWSPTLQGGLFAWWSDNGQLWTSLGQVIGEGHVITKVASTPQGLVAVEPGRNGSGITVWRSSIGVNWSADEVPAYDPQPFEIVYPLTVIGNDDTVVAASSSSFDLEGLVQKYLRDQGVEIDPSYLGFNLEDSDDNFELTVWGPLGLPLMVVTRDDLGLTPQDQESIDASFRGENNEVSVWTSRDDAGWVGGTIPNATWIATIQFIEDGTMLATGRNRTGNALWKSVDGIVWDPVSIGPIPGEFQPWDSGFVGVANTGRASVLYSDDGLAWTTLGLERMLPPPIEWVLSAFGTGPAGIAVAFQGWNPQAFAWPDESSEQPVVTRGDATLTLDYYNSQYTLDVGDQTIQGEIYPSSNLVNENATLDAANKLVVFHDPDTGDVLATFSFGELKEAEDAYRSTSSDALTQHSAFAFQGRQGGWTIQAGPQIAERFRFDTLEVTESRVIGLISTNDDPFGPSDPGFQIWTALIP